MRFALRAEMMRITPPFPGSHLSSITIRIRWIWTQVYLRFLSGVRSKLMPLS